ncbi:MAG: hypothetical protein F6J95_001415 [Leptolyngbya sp. SIO1E4]|nr:hypothetical protein [Leptolyngbya sp. SIO1E4]
MFPFHNTNTSPLPDANDIEREMLGPQAQIIDPSDYTAAMDDKSRQRFEADKRKLRNFIVGLLVMGLLTGGVLAFGLVWAMGRLSLIETPPLEQQHDE